MGFIPERLLMMMIMNVVLLNMQTSFSHLLLISSLLLTPALAPSPVMHAGRASTCPASHQCPRPYACPPRPTPAGPAGRAARGRRHGVRPGSQSRHSSAAGVRAMHLQPHRTPGFQGLRFLGPRPAGLGVLAQQAGAQATHLQPQQDTGERVAGVSAANW